MSEKKTLSQLLRTPEVFQAEETPENSGHWREALLDEFPPEVPRYRTLPVQPAEPERHPLQWHHAAKLSPLGLGLFVAGWLVGQGSPVGAALATVTPLVWVVASCSISLFYLGWRSLQGKRH